MTVSLEQNVYSVAEVDGFVEVCAVLEGQLTGFVSLQLSTMDGTAGLSEIYTYSSLITIRLHDLLISIRL